MTQQAHIRVVDALFEHADDIAMGKKVAVADLDSLVNLCVTRARKALDGAIPGYTDLHRFNIQSIFTTMQATHRTIRRVLQPGSENPGVIDAFTLARVQVEALFALCLIFEGGQWADRYIKDGWKKMYVRFLLQREETKKLARFQDFSLNVGPNNFGLLARVCGVSDAERATIEFEELGIPMGAGMVATRIAQFPSPRGVIEQIPDAGKKKMLMRLYCDYRRLCSFVHALGESNLLRLMFDKNSPYRGRFFSDGQMEETSHKEVAEPCIILSVLSVTQAAAELSALYPADFELRAAVADGARFIIDDNLLPMAVWQLRTRQLLGVLSPPPSP